MGHLELKIKYQLFDPYLNELRADVDPYADSRSSSESAKDMLETLRFSWLPIIWSCRFSSWAS